MRLSCAQCQAFDRILARHRAVIALDRCGSIDLQCLLLDVVKTKSHAMKDGVFSEVQSFRNSRTKKPRLRFGSAKHLADTHGPSFSGRSGEKRRPGSRVAVWASSGVT